MAFAVAVTPSADGWIIDRDVTINVTGGSFTDVINVSIARASGGTSTQQVTLDVTGAATFTMPVTTRGTYTVTATLTAAADVSTTFGVV